MKLRYIRKLTLAGFIAILIAILGVHIFHKVVRLSGSAAASTTSSSKQTVKNIDDTKLATTINSLLSENRNLDTSVAIIDLQTGKAYQYGDEAGYRAASITKLITAAAYLHTVESGDATLRKIIGGDNAQNQIKKMIVDSDNNAWSALNSSITSQGLEAYAQSVNVVSFDVTDNIVTSKDIASFLAGLYKGKLLNEEHTSLMLGYMKQAGLDGYIPAALDADLTVYHKAGWLDDRYNDAAIISNGAQQYVLVIFSKSSTDTTYDIAQGQKLFQAITHATTNSLFHS